MFYKSEHHVGEYVIFIKSSGITIYNKKIILYSGDWLNVIKKLTGEQS